MIGLQNYYNLLSTCTLKIEPYPIPIGYSYFWDILPAYPMRTPSFTNKKNPYLFIIIIFFIFSFKYVTKIIKNNKSGENINFRCNYMDVHFFYLLF